MIRVYVKSIDEWKDDRCYLESLKHISCQRQDKINAYAQKEDRIRSLGAFLLLQNAVEEWTERKESPLEFSFYKNNKPFLKDYRNLSMNLSHSGDYVACAISDGEIGIDLQKWNGYKGDLVERFFNKKEQEYLNSFPSLIEKEEKMYQIWTRMEAYAKYIGNGMKSDFRKIDTESGNKIRYCNMDLVDGYSICICFANTDKNLEPEIYIK